jgi:Ran GTPase-activating protein (RanGAP) involved in mRNA processing and transport
LSQLTSLTHADLSDVIAAQKTEDATEVLRTITESLCVHASLTSLDLSHNAMGLRGIEAIQRLLCERRDSLNHLYLNNCGYESNAIAHLHRCLLPETDSTTQLRSLQVGRNRFGGSGGCAEVTKIVARSPELTNLRVSSTSSPADEIRVLVEVLLLFV